MGRNLYNRIGWSFRSHDGGVNCFCLRVDVFVLQEKNELDTDRSALKSLQCMDTYKF
jgi:hypothetical protein